MWLSNIGHGRREIADAVFAQIRELGYAPDGSVHPATLRLAARVAALSPDPDSRVFFVSGGSEGVETAMKMAKKFHRNRGDTGRYKFIQFTSDWDGPMDGQGIDPDDLPGFGLYPWEIPSDNPWWSRPLKLGEIGCAISHWMCWQKAAGDAADPALIPVDEFIPALYMDHPREDIRSLYPKRLRAYALEPPLVTQLPKKRRGRK